MEGLALQASTGKENAFLLLTVVVFLWGFNAIAIKYLTSFFPPLALAPLRLCLASGFLLFVVWRRYGWLRLPRRAWGPVAMISLFCIFLHQIALTVGLQATSGTHAVLILGLNPLFTTAAAGFVLKEPFAPAKGLGICFGFSGLLCVVAGKGQSGATLAGDALMLVATLTFVVGSLFVRRATACVSPLVVTAYSHACAALGLALLGLASNTAWSYPGSLAPAPVAVLLFSSLLSTAVGALLWNMSIQRVGASMASLFQNASPVIGVLAAAFFLGEQLSWHHAAALLLVLLGVSVGTGLLRLPLAGRRWSRSSG